MIKEKKELQEKSLDKMTVTELREIAKEISDITGAHGMKKAELLVAVKEAKGVVNKTEKTVETKLKAKTAVTVQEIKALIKGLRVQKEQALADKDKRQANIYRRRISRLKKKTRQAA
jgi:hypothetical protein